MGRKGKNFGEHERECLYCLQWAVRVIVVNHSTGEGAESSENRIAERLYYSIIQKLYIFIQKTFGKHQRYSW